ncbi:MAG: hypothetical protein CBC09_08570 [Cellvibrionales bacterium TMED49]|nr:MAG: hypothetical protein CBC09_08570 [Cellvibrionales bacterium TMED49]
MMKTNTNSIYESLRTWPVSKNYFTGHNFTEENKKDIFLMDYKGKSWSWWLKRSFKENDLWISLNCEGVDDVKKWFNLQMLKIEERAFLKSNILSPLKKSNLYRFAVFVKKPNKHIHLIIRNIEYKSAKHNSFKEFLEYTFGKTLLNIEEKFNNRRRKEKRIDIQKFDISTVRSRYSLYKQECFEIDHETLNLFPTHL